MLPLGDFEPLGVLPSSSRTQPVADSWLLYSVGSDLRDDGAKVNDSSHVAKGDIIFPLPERNAMPRERRAVGAEGHRVDVARSAG